MANETSNARGDELTLLGLFDRSAERGATLSECGRYRYVLWRQWSDEPPALFVMLNPSTADAEVDDPTIRRCVGFGQRWSCGGVRVVNLYAWRATKPADLPRGREAIGEFTGLLSHNDFHIRREAERARRIIVAWGANEGPVLGRAADVLRILRNFAPWHPAEALARTASGSPRHPLYVRGDVEPVSYRERRAA